MSTPALEAKPELAAIVLAFPVPGADPLEELAGLPLALRTVLTLQKEGVTRVSLLVQDGRRDIGPRVADDKRVKIPVDVFPSLAPEKGLAAILPRAPGPVIIAMSHAVVDPAMYRALAQAPLDGALAVCATTAGFRAGPLLASPELGVRLRDAPGVTLEEAITSLAAEGRARDLPAGAWSAWVNTIVGKERAFYELFEACRKPLDGVVSRNLNRHISIFISKRIVALPITPNMLSVFTFILGVLGAWFASFGGYFPVLIGAFLFQWNSILDGVDGELARVRFQHSKLGQWLDTLSDDLSNVIFYAGLGIGALHVPGGRFLNAAAWIAVGSSVCASAIFYTEMIKKGTGDLYAIDWDFETKPPTTTAGKVLLFFRKTLKKDFAILFFFVLALFGVLPYGLVIICGAAIGNLIAGVTRALKKRKLALAK